MSTIAEVEKMARWQGVSVDEFIVWVKSEQERSRVTLYVEQNLMMDDPKVDEFRRHSGRVGDAIRIFDRAATLLERYRIEIEARDNGVSTPLVGGVL